MNERSEIMHERATDSRPVCPDSSGAALMHEWAVHA